MTGAVVGSLFALGWFWGVTATDRPKLSLGYLPGDAVHLWTTDPGGRVTLWWTTESSGRVELVVWLDRSSEEPAHVIVALECDARLRDLQLDTYLAEVSVQDMGTDPRGCTTGSLGDDPALNQQMRAKTPAQVFDVRFFGDQSLGRGQIWGQPLTPWSDEVGGERMSYAPFVSVGGYATRYSDALSRNLFTPAYAVVLTKLLSASSETVESFFPPQMDALGAGAIGRVRADMSRISYQTRGPEISWEASWSRQAQVDTTGARVPSYIHTAAMARWSDSGGLARAQLRLLLAGLMLGIAGAVAVEGLFAWAGHTTSSAHTTTSRPASGLSGQGSREPNRAEDEIRSNEEPG